MTRNYQQQVIRYNVKRNALHSWFLKFNWHCKGINSASCNSNMNVCKHVCLCVCNYVYTFTNYGIYQPSHNSPIHSPIHASTQTSIDAHTHTHYAMYTYKYISLYTNTFICKHSSVHIHKCTCMQKQSNLPLISIPELYVLSRTMKNSS